LSVRYGASNFDWSAPALASIKIPDGSVWGVRLMDLLETPSTAGR